MPLPWGNALISVAAVIRCATPINQRKMKKQYRDLFLTWGLFLLIGFGVGYLVFHKKEQTAPEILNVLDAQKQQADSLKAVNDSLTVEIAYLKHLDVRYKLNEDEIHTKHAKDRSIGVYDGSREERLQSIHNDLSTLYDR